MERRQGRSRLRIKFISSIGAIALLTAACGQKSGVADEPLPRSATDINGPHAGPPLWAATPGGAGSSASSAELLPQSVTVSTADAPRLEGATSTADSTRIATSTSPPRGGDATGVGGSTITIGVHAPLTGAGPFPASIDGAKDLYFRWIERQGRAIAGRDVEVVLRDDADNPSKAVAVCKEMVERHRVFLLTGIGGPDQIYACARYAASIGIPYLSSGATEIGLSALPTYFSLWMSFPEQASLLADMLVTDMGARRERNAIIRHNSVTNLDTRDAFVDGMRARGATVHYDGPMSKNGSAEEAAFYAVELKQRDIDNVFTFLPPRQFIPLAKAAAAQGYKPQWVAVGLSLTFEVVADFSCPNLDGARMFSPYSALRDIDRFDPDFNRAFAAFHPEEDPADKDLYWVGWGFMKLVAKMLALPGRNLTRERFVYFAERAEKLSTGVLPPASFTSGDHFGGTGTHVLRADCDEKRFQRWLTDRAFARDF